MEGFNLIQNFFTRMRCHFCSTHLSPDGVELIRHDNGVFIVNVHCTHCTRQMGIALVGMEGSEVVASDAHYEDPELTEAELERLGNFAPVNFDDVLDAHTFFSGLDSGWMQHLPEEMRQLDITLETESD